MKKVCFHWFRRDLRLEDNHALYRALRSGFEVVPLFIFDSEILEKLEQNDPRVQFIHEQLESIHASLLDIGSALVVKHGKPTEVWKELMNSYSIDSVYTNEDYEPYAQIRDAEISDILDASGIKFQAVKDQVIFAPGEILKGDGTPYTVYTPYSKKCFAALTTQMMKEFPTSKYFSAFYCCDKRKSVPSLKALGFQTTAIKVRNFNIEKSRIAVYNETRDLPAQSATSDLSPHLRFGTLSIRRALSETLEVSHTFAKELFWREFFMQILYHFPHVVERNFRPKYDRIPWRNNEEEFNLWCEGKTGFPMVDAGMRELNATGYMHNRVRMVTAGFLCKHLLIDWQWGEAYFAQKLLDYELASNNGNWQWAAGTGCDAAPYFRVFNPTSQLERFDKKLVYINRWIPEYGTSAYPAPMVEHKMARLRALETYKLNLVT